jgi:hypothetical protein
VEELRKYAAVFNIPVANLLQVILVNEGGNFESALILENQAEKISIEQNQTINPFVVLTKIAEKLK